MRSLSVLTVLLLLATPADAADDLTVLPSQSDGVPPRKMLYQYLETQAKKHFDTRRAEVAKLQTPADVFQRGRQLRERFVAALGGWPERTPLNARVVGTLAGDGYRIDKVIYESRPGHHVTANLYLPAGTGPFPAVLMPIGHSANGKAADYVQRGCILLAKNGLAALAYDPIGQGERSQLLDAQGKPALGGSTNEHTALGVGALLVGRNTASYRVWDGIRSLDYLASRPDIDAKRLGCTGCSGGGTLTSYLMALDDRIVAAAPSCYLTSLERLFATIGPQDAEQNITGQVAFGMEHADYLTMHLPRPTLICAASRDFFDIQGTWTTFREAKQLYGLAGHAERVDLAEFNTTHGYPKPQREAVVRWMRRWLLNKDDAPVEEDFAIRKDAELACTRTGQVLDDLKGASAFDLNVACERELAAERVKFQKAHGTEELLKEIRRRIGLAEVIAPATKQQVGTLKREGIVIDKLVFETEPGIRVAALEFRPTDQEASRLPYLLAVSGDGKAKDAAVGGAYERQAKAGRRVLALDLRGLGETAPNPTPANRRNLHGGDTKEAFLALHLARPLLGQRTYDLLAVCRCLRQEGAKELEVVGEGTAVPAVLHATALEPSLARVRIQRPALASWSEVVRQPLAENQLTNVVPGALEVYDLPDLVRLLGPRLSAAPAKKNGAWDFDTWKTRHQDDAPRSVTSQAGKQDLEPLLSFVEDGQPRVIRSAEDWAKRRQELRKVLVELAGPLPPKGPPLNAEVLSEEKHGQLVVRKVSYTAERGETIPAYCFFPPGFLSLPPGARKPLPAVICLHQTNAKVGSREPSGLAGDPTLAFALQLAERGYVTLAPDAICFGERYRAGDPYQHYGDAVGYYQTHPQGSIMGKMVGDVGRAIDYLESLPGVDKDRIGCIGHSHGAYGTIFAMALDERLKVGVASCGFTTFRTDPRFERWYRLTALMPRLGFYEGHVRDTPIDFHHVLSLVAPRPFFNSAALDDSIFPRTDNMPWVNAEVKKVYGLHGVADAYDSYVFKGGHKFPPEARDQAYAFLDKWLKGK